VDFLEKIRTLPETQELPGCLGDRISHEAEHAALLACNFWDDNSGNAKRGREAEGVKEKEEKRRDVD
jgi:hypothetical protein